MMFDTPNFLKYIGGQVDLYMSEILKDITNKNPGWIEKIKNDKDLYNEDGTPRKDLSVEDTKKKVDEIISSADFTIYEFKEEVIKKLFIVDEEILKKFIINDNSESSK